MTTALIVFDLDGTLLDSDTALRDPFIKLGVPAEQISFGHVIADECMRLGISLDDYLSAYDTSYAQPFAGVEAMLAGVGRWAICSNKHPRSGEIELKRLGWKPEAAWFADRFDGPKDPGPLLHSLGVEPRQALFVGDTEHDRRCAAATGCRFVLAGWNPRAEVVDGDLVASRPEDVLRFAQS